MPAPSPFCRVSREAWGHQSPGMSLPTRKTPQLPPPTQQRPRSSPQTTRPCPIISVTSFYFPSYSLQPHRPSLCSSNRPSIILPQGLCICCYLFLQTSSQLPPHHFKSSLRCHLLNEALSHVATGLPTPFPCRFPPLPLKPKAPCNLLFCLFTLCLSQRECKPMRARTLVCIPHLSLRARDYFPSILLGRKRRLIGHAARNGWTATQLTLSSQPRC